MLFTGGISAQADQTKTETFTFNAPLQSLTSAGDFSLPAFDTSLGTLEDLKLSLAVTSSGPQLVYNSYGKPVGFQTVSTPVPAFISGPGDLVLNSITPVNVSSVSGNPGIGGLSTRFAPATLPLKSSSAATKPTTLDITDPVELSQWEGQDGNAVNLSYEGTTPNTGFFPHAVKGTCKVTVTYTYDIDTVATPEPPGKYLSAIVALGMVFMLIRRRHLFRS